MTELMGGCLVFSKKPVGKLVGNRIIETIEIIMLLLCGIINSIHICT